MSIRFSVLIKDLQRHLMHLFKFSDCMLKKKKDFTDTITLQNQLQPIFFFTNGAFPT